MKDLFETPELLPESVQGILNDFLNEEMTYGECREMLRLCKEEGYTFEFGLDAIPFNLTKIE
jgi:hypothetical protein